jgi:hypothetical protein
MEQNTIGYLGVEFAVDPMILYRMTSFRRLPLPLPSLPASDFRE